MAVWLTHNGYDSCITWSGHKYARCLAGEIQQQCGLFADIAEQYDITIEEMEVSPDHIHIFCSFRLGTPLRKWSRDSRV